MRVRKQQTILFQTLVKSKRYATSNCTIARIIIPTKPEAEMNVRDLIATAEEHLRAATGLHVSSKIAAGDWQTALIAEAKGIGADCIFVSSGSSINDQDAGQPGMVSATLLNGAPCSVEVVRQEGMTLTLISSSKPPPVYLLVAVRRAADRRQAESGRRFRLRPRNLSSGLL